MHIILRYEMERALLSGALAVSDVPKVWNEKMRAYLGAEPADDAQGCLQDIHWSVSSFFVRLGWTLFCACMGAAGGGADEAARRSG
jgi:carboxypeptidase Taq